METDLKRSLQDQCYLSLVIPAYNEEVRLGSSLPRILNYFSRKEYAFEIIIIDDGSKDATGDVINQYIKVFPNLRLLKNERNLGKGYSVKRGMITAQGRFIFFSDADSSTPIEEIETLLEFLEDGYDIAIGSRSLIPSKVLVRQRWHRDRMGKVFGKIVRLMVAPGIADSQCGFKGFSRKAAEKIFPLQRLNGFSFDAEVLFIAKKLKLAVKEVPVEWTNYPESKLNPFLDSIKMLFELLRIRWNDLRRLYG